VSVCHRKVTGNLFVEKGGTSNLLVRTRGTEYGCAHLKRKTRHFSKGETLLRRWMGKEGVASFPKSRPPNDEYLREAQRNFQVCREGEVVADQRHPKAPKRGNGEFRLRNGGTKRVRYRRLIKKTNSPVSHIHFAQKEELGLTGIRKGQAQKKDNNEYEYDAKWYKKKET